MNGKKFKNFVLSGIRVNNILSLVSLLYRQGRIGKISVMAVSSYSSKTPLKEQIVSRPIHYVYSPIDYRYIFSIIKYVLVLSSTYLYYYQVIKYVCILVLLSSTVATCTNIIYKKI